MVKKILYIILVLVVIGGLGYKYLYHFTPRQTVTHALHALKSRNRSAWDRLVNTEALTSQTYAIYQKQFEVRPSDEVTERLDKIINQFSQFLSTDKSEEMNEVIDHYFSGVNEGLYQSTQSEFEKIIKNLGTISIDSQTINDNDAIVNVSIIHKEYNYPFKLKILLKKEGQDWKVFSLLNINEFLHMYYEKEIVRKNKSIDEMTKKMIMSLQIENYSGSTYDYWFKNVWPLSNVPIFRTKYGIKVKNISTKPITSFGVKISFRQDGNFAQVEQSIISESHPLDINEERVLSGSSYNPIIYSAISSQQTPVITMLYIEFEDGTRIENPENMESRFLE